MRSGVTLLELLLGLTLMSGVALLGSALLSGGRRGFDRLSRRMELGQGPDRAALLLQLELAGRPGGLQLLSPSVLALQSRVGEAAACDFQAGEVVIPRQLWPGHRLPEAGRDQAQLLDDSDGYWRAADILAVDAGTCPDGSVGLRLRLQPAVRGQYLRVVEPLHLKIYRSGGAGWFGLAPADGSAPVQPFAGPLAEAEFVGHAGYLELLGRTSGQQSFRRIVPMAAR